jgi:hypothetical protein
MKIDAISDSLDRMLHAQANHERVIFPGSICPASPNTTVKLYLGRHDEVLSIYPGLQEELAALKSFGPVYYYVESKRFPGAGVLQTNVGWPVLQPDPPTLQKSLRLLSALAGTWKEPINLFIPDTMGGGVFLEKFLEYWGQFPLPQTCTLWSRDYSL